MIKINTSTKKIKIITKHGLEYYEQWVHYCFIESQKKIPRIKNPPKKNRH